MSWKIVFVLPFLAHHALCYDTFGFSELLPTVLTKSTPNFLGYSSDDIAAPAHISLHSADNCSLPVWLTSGATDGGYVWTPHSGFPTGKEFELELNQGGRAKRSKRFVLKERQFDSSSLSGFSAAPTANPSAAEPVAPTIPSTAVATVTETANSSPTDQGGNSDQPDANSGSSSTPSNTNGANTSTNNNSINTSSSLSTGAAIGIGVAVGVVAIGLLAVIALWWFRRYKRKHQLYGPRGDRVEIGELPTDGNRHEMEENVARRELPTKANRHELSGSQRKHRGASPSELAAD